jgi:hypothetical protein
LIAKLRIRIDIDTILRGGDINFIGPVYIEYANRAIAQGIETDYRQIVRDAEAREDRAIMRGVFPQGPRMNQEQLNRQEEALPADGRRLDLDELVNELNPSGRDLDAIINEVNPSGRLDLDAIINEADPEEPEPYHPEPEFDHEMLTDGESAYLELRQSLDEHNRRGYFEAGMWGYSDIIADPRSPDSMLIDLPTVEHVPYFGRVYMISVIYPNLRSIDPRSELDVLTIDNNNHAQELIQAWAHRLKSLDITNSPGELSVVSETIHTLVLKKVRMAEIRCPILRDFFMHDVVCDMRRVYSESGIRTIRLCNTNIRQVYNLLDNAYGVILNCPRLKQLGMVNLRDVPEGEKGALIRRTYPRIRYYTN